MKESIMCISGCQGSILWASKYIWKHSVHFNIWRKVFWAVFKYEGTFHVHLRIWKKASRTLSTMTETIQRTSKYEGTYRVFFQICGKLFYALRTRKESILCTSRYERKYRVHPHTWGKVSCASLNRKGSTLRINETSNQRNQKTNNGERGGRGPGLANGWKW